MADEVPARARRFVPQLADLLVRLLHTVLAEVSEAGGDGFKDERSRVRLTDGDERDLLRVAARTRGAQLYAASHLLCARAQTRRPRTQLDAHCCNSVADGDEYNKRARAQANCFARSRFNAMRSSVRLPAHYSGRPDTEWCARARIRLTDGRFGVVA